jgi:DNA-binding transcriptional LysR family regulator
MTSNIPWEWYRSLLAVLTEGSLSGAARALDVTQPTIGRHIAALEQALNLVLFTRSPAGLLPTDAAQSLRSHAQAMEHTAAALLRAAASEGEGVRGVVRVTASEAIGVEVLPPILAGLRAQHPLLKVELVLSNRVQDLLLREADIAVRMTPPSQDQLIARPVGTIEIGLHASADYLSRCGQPQQLDELAGHTLIGYDAETPFIRSVARRMPALSREQFSLRADSDLAQMALVRSGAGIGFYQVPLATRDGLQRVLPGQVSFKLATWITMHEDLRNSARCRVAFEALVAGLQGHAG